MCKGSAHDHQVRLWPALEQHHIYGYAFDDPQRDWKIHSISGNGNTTMRLLDLIAQGRSAAILTDEGSALPTADRFKRDVIDCPLRYVLSDELVRCATHLAYAEGDRLSACLDLIRIPSRSVWVEWADKPRQDALADIRDLAARDPEVAQRAGTLITATPDCRAGALRTFWSTRDDLAFVSPVVTNFNLDGLPDGPNPPNSGTWQGDAILQLPEEPAIDELLAHLRFHFDGEWADYYSASCLTDRIKASVLQTNLGCVAFDMPMLLGFFLLLGARNLLPTQMVRNERINRMRGIDGRPRLLEHVEVSAPLNASSPFLTAPGGDSSRTAPRLHHVRGHLVRRGANIFWRCPHLRGSARLGQVRSRTVKLTYNRPAAQMLDS